MDFNNIDEVTPLTEEQWERAIGFHRERLGKVIESVQSNLEPYISEVKYKRLMYGEWLTESEQERKLRELAETYHTGCDAYDKRVCTGTSPRTGEAMPITNDEMDLVNRHARQMRETVVSEGESMGLTRQQVEQAIRKYVPPQGGNP